MTAAPAVKLAVMNDLHIGGPEGGGFQNWFLTTDAVALMAPTIEAINANGPDLVLIPGDLTHDATNEQLSQVLACLNDLECEFIACKGNHDCQSPEAAARFNRMVGKPGLPGVTSGPTLGLPDGIAVLSLEASWMMDNQPYLAEAPPLAMHDTNLIDRALADLDQLRPDWLLVVSHYPLLSQADYVRSQGGRYAGHVRDGQELLDQLLARAGAVICFCGHNHFHHIVTGDRWLQCATGALAEYPAELRTVTLEDGSVIISTLTGAAGLLEHSPAPQHTWVRGRSADRELIWHPK